MTPSKLKALMRWALDRALEDPLEVANKPFRHCGVRLVETRESCGPNEPIPRGGTCSAAYLDPSGWTACMDWKHDQPEISQVGFEVSAKIPVTCGMLGASQLGRPWGTLDGPRQDNDWLGRLCTLRDHGIVVSQQRPYTRGGDAFTTIWVYSSRFIDFDEDAAKRLEYGRMAAGLLVSR
jgi:hypothetical protein